jgi:aspartate-semialdehyde dehydrogenase
LSPQDARLSTAIVGARGYIGRHFARLLADHPWFGPPKPVGGPRSIGRTLSEGWLLAESGPPELPDLRLRESTPAELGKSGVQVVFSALPSGTAGPYERELTSRGIAVFSNASDHRQDPEVPLLVPEVNPVHLKAADRRAAGSGLLVANPNCSATGLALGLAPVLKLLEPEAVFVTTYQALSGAGYPGVASLSIADNIVPYIPDEEEKLARETRQILGRLGRTTVTPAPFEVLANTARVGVRDGHLESVTLKAQAEPSLSEVVRAWRKFAPLVQEALPTAPSHPIEVRPEPDRPQPVRDRWAGSPSRARGMAASIGRVRWDPPFLRFFLLTHNAVRGGAGGSVLNAELSYRRGLIRPRQRR